MGSRDGGEVVPAGLLPAPAGRGYHP